MTDGLIKKGIFRDRHVYKETVTGRLKQKSGRHSYKTRNTKVCQKTTRSWGEAGSRFSSPT
jgi:hypothetical protein